MDYELPYDQLVLALGSVTNRQRIPGSANALTFKTLAVALLKANDKAHVLSVHPAALPPEYPPDGRRSLEKAQEMEALAWAHGYHRFEWAHRKLDGEVFPLEVTLNPVEIGGKPAMIVVWHDLTEIKRTHGTPRQLAVVRAAGSGADRAGGHRPGFALDCGAGHRPGDRRVAGGERRG